MAEYRVPLVSEIKRALAENGPKFEVVSLFAGGGGSSTGYRMAGGEVLAVNEFVDTAIQTYHANWPETIIFPQDIRKLEGKEILEKTGKKKGELDILDGSPPCTFFSTAGKIDKAWNATIDYHGHKQENIETLFYDYIRILDDLRPKAFVAENVAGLVKGKCRGYFNDFMRCFEKSGYRTTAKVLDARWMGIPQTRSRVIFVGVRSDLWREEFAGKTHPTPMKSIVKLKDAFKGLQFTDQDKKETDKSRYMIYKQLVRLKPGQRGVKHFSLTKASPDYCSPCIVAADAFLSLGGSCHWDNRAFTIAELKRIMSIPDDYIIFGNYHKQVERLGLMVPPFMTKAIAENLYTNILSKIEKKEE